MNNKTISRLTKAGALGLFTAAVIGLTACGDPKLKVTYSVDGKIVEELPDQGLYEIKSIKTNNKNANATWDCNTWSLKTDTLTKNTTVDLDFTYTSHPFTVNGMGYDTLQEAFNAAGTTSAKICLTKDAEGSGVTAVGSDITLSLNGFTLDGAGSDTIVNNGSMTITGAGTLTNTAPGGDNSKTLVNFGTMTVSDVTIENSTKSFSVWNSNNGQSSMSLTNCTVNRSETEIIPVINSGIMTVSGCTISGCGDLTHPTLLQNDGKASLTISGSTITNGGAGYSVYRESGTVNMDSSTNAPNPYGIEDSAPAEVIETPEVTEESENPDVI